MKVPNGKLFAPALLLSSALLAGCNAPSAPAPAAPAADPAAQAPVQPKTNRLVMALVPPQLEYNTPRNGSQPTAWQLGPMYEYLISVDNKSGKLAPGLAESWKLENGNQFRFALRKGVQFQKSAGDFTAKDVLFTHDDFIRPDSEHGEAKYWRDTVGKVDVVNDYEVLMTLTRPDGDFLNAVSQQQGDMMAIQSKAFFDKNGEPTLAKEPTAGTGPYAFKERSQGAYIRYERVPFKHWRATPDFPEFEFRWVREASTRLAGLLTGEIHVTSLPEDLLGQAEKQSQKTVPSQQPGLRVFFGFLCCFLNDFTDQTKGMYVGPDGQTPMMDVRVRKALNKAVDRAALNKAFFGGKGEPMLANHMLPTRPGWNPDYERRWAEAYGFDQNAARAILTEAGYGPSKPLSVGVVLRPAAGIAGSDDISEAVATQWRNIGVNVTFDQPDPAQLTPLGRQRRWTNHVGITGTGAAPLIGMVWNSTSGGRNSNFSGAQDPELEAVVKQLYDTVELEKQDPMFRKAGDIVFEKYLSLPLFWLRAQAVVNPKFVDDYVFPGTISGTWTHVEYLKTAK